MYPSRPRRSLSLLGLALSLMLGSQAAAEDSKPEGGDAVKDCVKGITTALSKNDLPGLNTALKQAESLHAKTDAKKFAPVVAITGKGIASKTDAIALACVTSLGNMRVSGSSKFLDKLLKPPAKPEVAKRQLYLAALTAAGAIHDEATAKVLEKLLTHPDPEVAAGAASALAGYSGLATKPRLAMIGRLIPTLAKFEASAASAKKDDEKAAAESVRAALAETIRTLAGDTGATNAKEWSAWLKKASKEPADKP